MKEIIKSIFTDSNFKIEATTDDIYYFEKLGSAEYFIVDFIDKGTAYSYIQENIKQEVLDLFESKKSEKSDAVKNTSLIICIKVNNIKSDIEDIKNEIFNIEEDEYWFKKYVIVYTEQSLNLLLENNQSVIHSLNTRLYNQEYFEAFKKDIYLNETQFLVIQLFIKLPFLRVPFTDSSNFQSLRTILSSTLTASQISLLDRIDDIQDMNNNENWNALRQSVLAIDSNEDVFSNFLTKYKIDAEDK